MACQSLRSTQADTGRGNSGGMRLASARNLVLIHQTLGVDPPKPGVDPPKPCVDQPKPGVDPPKPCVDPPKPDVDPQKKLKENVQSHCQLINLILD